MTVLRINKKEKNFLILDKTCLNESTLSWGAKGLHAFLMSLPDNWKIRVIDLQKRASNGRDAVRAFLSELEKTGYIKKETKRLDETGQFNGMEYLVLEMPEPDFKPNLPEPENPFSAKNAVNTPGPGNPFTDYPASGNPSPGNPPLININKINNNLINNKTAAEEDILQDSVSQIEEKNAAAVIDSQKQVAQISTKTSKIYVLSVEDSYIGEQLTVAQEKRVDVLVEQLHVDDKARMKHEICHSLLNKANFTGCGNNFGKKLNAIRLVIQRGDWQTPSDLLLWEFEPIEKAMDEKERIRKSIQLDLQQAHAELQHFQKYFDASKKEVPPYVQQIMDKAKIKIQQL